MSVGAVARRWIIVAASASFAAGLTLGLLAPQIVRAVAPEASSGFDESYLRFMIDNYDLDAEQVRQVRMVLEERDREKQRLVLQNVGRLPDALQTEVLQIDRRARNRIKYVLTDAQRARLLLDSELSPGEAGTELDEPVKPQDR